MKISDLERNKYIQIVEYSLENENFSAEDLQNETGITRKYFHVIKHSLYYVDLTHEVNFNNSKAYNWHLKPEVLFQYMSYIQYKQAVKSGKIATFCSTVSIFIAVIAVVVSVLNA